MEELFDISERLIDQVNLNFQRFLMQDINWEDRLIGIKGPRGVGKTTLLLQWLNIQDLGPTRQVYLSLDHIYFTNNSLWEVGSLFAKKGGEILILDEVHKYLGWTKEIKNLYDAFPQLKIIFTGSSIIDLSQQPADLSRRALMYELPGLSYREYLHWNGQLDDRPAFTLDELSGETKEIRKKFPPSFRPLAHFEAYLKQGYYPFAKESLSSYHQRLEQLIRTIVEFDLIEQPGFDVRNARKLLQLLYIIAQSVPFKPNVSKLADRSGIHRNSLLNYLLHLERARLIRLLNKPANSIAALQKPEKIYLHNPNLLYAFPGLNPEKGMLRETFFLDQVSYRHAVADGKQGDFLLDSRRLFEIGGPSKGRAQIKEAEQAWLVKDELEYPTAQALPLWLFGFLY